MRRYEIVKNLDIQNPVKRLGKINIQIFANKPVDLTEGEQVRYQNTVMKRLGGVNTKPLERYMAKSTSNSAKGSIFYVGGQLIARDRGSNVNGAGNNFNDITGVDSGKLITSILVQPTAMETPVWVDDREFDKSQLGEQGAIVDMQVESIYAGLDKRLSTLFKDCITDKKRTVKNTNNQSIDITIPEANFMGDKAKPFSEQVKLFKRAMRRAKKYAKATNKLIAIVTGEEGMTELEDCKEFTNKDWVTINGETPNQTGEPLRKLLGGYTEELFTFDQVMYPREETEGYILIIVQDAFGQDTKKAEIKPTIDYVKHKKAYFMDVEVSNATELLQGEGFIVFSYKRDLDMKKAPITKSYEPTQAQEMAKELAAVMKVNNEELMKSIKTMVQKEVEKAVWKETPVGTTGHQEQQEAPEVPKTKVASK